MKKGVDWFCDICGEISAYMANRVCYCDKHWDEYLNRTHGERTGNGK